LPVSTLSHYLHHVVDPLFYKRYQTFWKVLYLGSAGRRFLVMQSIAIGVEGLWRFLNSMYCATAKVNLLFICSSSATFIIDYFCLCPYGK